MSVLEYTLTSNASLITFPNNLSMAHYPGYRQVFGTISQHVAWDMEKAQLSHMGVNGEIGAHGDLPWGQNLPGDLAQFKERTIDGSIVMGRRTFESIEPLLPNRENIVVSSIPTGVPGFSPHCPLRAPMLSHATIFIIGGARLYRTALPTVDVVYNEVDAVFPDADTFSKLGSEWQEVVRRHHGGG